jgi:hypothetical protein
MPAPGETWMPPATAGSGDGVPGDVLGGGEQPRRRDVALLPHSLRLGEHALREPARARSRPAGMPARGAS